MAILGIGSERQVRPAETSRHDAVDRCSDGMQMTVVVAVVWKMVEQRADAQTCSGGGDVGVGVGGSGAVKLELSSAVMGLYPRRHVCLAATVFASSCSLYWRHPQLRTSLCDPIILFPGLTPSGQAFSLLRA